jgi:hypothetical protein
MTTKTKTSDLENVLTLFLEHPYSLRVLAGEMEVPELDELSFFGGKQKAATKRLTQGRGENLDDAIANTIESAGGWPHIINSAQGWIRAHRAEWKALIEYIVFAKPMRRSRVEIGVSERVAERHGMTADALIQLADRFPGKLAEAIIGTANQSEV